MQILPHPTLSGWPAGATTMVEPNFHSSPSYPMEPYIVVVSSMKVSQTGYPGQVRDSRSNTSLNGDLETRDCVRGRKEYATHLHAFDVKET